MTFAELMKLFKGSAVFIALFTVVCTALTAVFCWVVLPDVYKSTVSMYVLTKDAGDAEVNELTDSDLDASGSIATDITRLLGTNNVERKAALSLGLGSLDGYDIDVESSSASRVIDLTVSGADPQGVAQVANALASAADQVAVDVMEVKSVNVLDDAVAPTHPSGPNRIAYTLAAFVISLVVAAALVIARRALDTRLRDADDAVAAVGAPLIGSFAKVAF